MAKLLLVCAGARDLRELAAIGAGSEHTICRHDYGTDALEQLVAGHGNATPPLSHPRAEVEGIVRRHAGGGLDGVISTDDYPGSTLASIVAQRLGLPGVDPVADLTCQHKYLSRIAQAAVAPDAVPWFARIDPGVDDHPDVSYPAFVKPVKSFFSIGARRVDSAEALQRAVASNPVTAEFLQPLDWFLREFTGRGVGPPLLAEGLLTGVQATLDGFVRHGQAVPLGVVDSIMFPGTISFERFEYPSSLSQSVQRRMAGIASSVMTSTGFDNGMFNIEFMYDRPADALSIIEINPRMSSQFADLYQKVDGFNPYRVMVDLALGRDPETTSRRGRFRMAASCVLRTFADRHVVCVPTAAQVAQLCGRYPELRVEILAAEGTRLSQAMQDGNSFRYGLVNIGGRDRAEILRTFAACRTALPFVLRPIGGDDRADDANSVLASPAPDFDPGRRSDDRRAGLPHAQRAPGVTSVCDSIVTRRHRRGRSN